MRTFLNENDLLLNQNENFEILTKDKPVITTESVDFKERISNKPSVVVFNYKPQNIKAIETVANTYNCNILVVENTNDIIPDISFLQDNSVMIYSNKNKRISYNEPLDKQIRDILKNLGFYMNSKDTLLFIEIIKVVYKSNKLFYTLEDMYKCVGNKYGIESNKIRRYVIEAVDVMNNHIDEELLHTFFRTNSPKVAVKDCMDAIVEYLHNIND